MIELTEVFDFTERSGQPSWSERVILVNPRHIVTARPSRCAPVCRCDQQVYRIKLVTGEVVFVTSGAIDNNPQDWAKALAEAA